MARVTVEDCILTVRDRFELVVLSSKRARDIYLGLPTLVKRDNDKSTVIALREIAAKKLSPELLKEEIVSSYQKNFRKSSNSSMIAANDDEISGESKEVYYQETDVKQAMISDMFSDENIDVED